MVSRKVLLCIAFGLLTFAATSDAVCKICTKTSYAACFNDTAFKYCFNGVDISIPEIIGVCLPNQVCRDGTCKSSDETTPECESCHSCFNGFTCNSQSRFEVCDGPLDTAKPTGVVGKCPVGEYCNLGNVAKGHICVKSCLDDPTCFKPDDPPTIILTPAEICKGKTLGFYDNTSDPTCTSYLYCDGDTKAIVFNCTDSYFDEDALKCTATKPSKCA